MRKKQLVPLLSVAAALMVASTARAQSEGNWIAEFGIGWDNSISGNINSGAIGTLNNQTTVITKNSYEDVYGTGLNLRFGGGYKMNPSTEARVTFTFQSLDADLTRMGDYGASNLYGQYSDYQALSLDVGLRKYGRVDTNLRPYAEGSIGIGFVDKVDVELAAPQANLVIDNTDFYDQTTAFALSINAGLLWNLSSQLGFFGQLGVRYVSGMAEVDNLADTSLDAINDNSSRWTMPFLVGIRFGF